ncbi:class I SAM-dependent methyltransferase [Nonomuraea sp. B12E4]|uniref:class I SAM-dependent methyltransferase n=1 Tax=Nonomuraea sp. B12E4 TaxID=3153564 RepID=UPI00325ED954
MTHICRICGGAVQQFLDLGRQPLSKAFLKPAEAGRETSFDLTVGICASCTMVQQLGEVSRDLVFGPRYPYRSSGSPVMRKHFERLAQRFLNHELAGAGRFVVEIGSNDGIFLKTISEGAVAHLGVDPCPRAAEIAEDKGVEVLVDFFEEDTATQIRATHGPADVIYSANTLSHLPYLPSALRGVDALLSERGVFVVEDRYLGDIVAHTRFDQIYDEHFYLFTVRSVQAAAALHGFELVDAKRLPVHGGSIRYTLARPGVRPQNINVGEFLAQERAQGLGDPATMPAFAERVQRARDELRTLLRELHDSGKLVVGYGATSKSATVTTYCGIGPDLVPYVIDGSPVKHGRLTPGSHIPIRSPKAFSDPYPDYALLFAWDHADEIMAKEREFRKGGGRWILYVPEVRIV